MRKSRFSEEQVILAVHTQTHLPPEHGLSDAPLGFVVGWHGAIVMDVDPQAVPLAQDVLGGTTCLFRRVGAISEGFQPLTDIGLDGFHPQDQFLPIDLVSLERVPQVESLVTGEFQQAALGSGLAQGKPWLSRKPALDRSSIA